MPPIFAQGGGDHTNGIGKRWRSWLHYDSERVQGRRITMVNWNAVYKRICELMDVPGETYFSGSRFIRKIQEFDEFQLDYTEYIQERKAAGQSTTRRDFYKDILKALDEGVRVQVVSSILDEEERHAPERSSEIRKLLGGGTLSPTASVPAEVWNGNRLKYLGQIDGAIASGNYQRAVTLSYTCLEGFLGAFVRAKDKRTLYPHEIIALSKEVKDYLKETIKDYPDEVLNGITQAAHAVDKARNRFSESHFANEAGSWLATYVRDLTNTQIRLLLHFM